MQYFQPNAAVLAGVVLSLVLASGWPSVGQAKAAGERRQERVQPAGISITPASDSAVTLEKREEGEHRYLLAGNPLPGPVEMEVILREATNMVAEPPLPHRIVLPPHSSAPIITLRRQDPAQDGGIRYAYGYLPGSPDVRHREDYPYLPPISPGSTYRITQGFFGQHSHHGEQNQYAVDIGMPKRTPVHAARGGVVMGLEDGVSENGVEAALRFHANQLRILHDDGTMAVYAHLTTGSGLVQIGDQVEAGQRIGYSGNSGYSSGPHLHFVIQHNTGMKLESLPFRFVLPDSTLREPAEGMLLQGAALAQNH
ncbi:MAG: M23 family metallopeptidase [Methylococcaceae bacterium]|nr:MAG: M23 family metallopeptidase [Methylococcaceae bacterium]